MTLLYLSSLFTFPLVDFISGGWAGILFILKYY
jgi:hypothetical protein